VIAALADPSEVLVSSTVKDLTQAPDSYSRTRANTNSRASRTVGASIDSSAEVDELAVVLRTATSTGRVAGVEVTIYNPTLDRTGVAGRNLVATLTARTQHRASP
jgi:hypothetical protein